MVDVTTLKPPETTILLKPTYFWRRRRFWIWLFVLFIVAVVGFVASLPTTRALVQFYRVKAGMTEQEVVELMGKSGTFHESKRAPGHTSRSWYVGRLSFHLRFRNGAIYSKGMYTDLPIAHRLFPNLWNERNLL